MNQRTIDDPLPDFVTEYLDTKVDAVIATLMQLEFQIKDAKDLEKAKALFETLKTQGADQMEAHDALAPKLEAIKDNAASKRAYDAVAKRESALRDHLKRVSPLIKDLMKGARRRATRGRRVRKATRRGRRGHF